MDPNLEHVLKFAILVITGGLGGALLTYVLNRYVAHRNIEYRTSYIPLLQVEPATGSPVQLAVDKFMLTGNDADKGQLESISNAYGFTIAIKNMGADTTDVIELNVDFDKKAKILQFNSNITQVPNYLFAISRDERLPHRLNVHVPYLNSNEYLYIFVVTTSNENPEISRVDGRGRGIRVRAYRSWIANVYVLIGLGLLAVMATLVNPNNWSTADYIPPAIYKFLGASVGTAQVRVIIWPLWYELLSAALGFGIAGLLIYRGISRLRIKTWS